MYEFYLTGDYEDPSLRLIDMQWLQYTETRIETLDVWNSYLDSGTDQSNVMLALAPLNAAATYLGSNDFVRIRFSDDDGASYSNWGSCLYIPSYPANSKIILEFSAQNPNYSGAKGYALFSLNFFGQDSAYEGAAIWDDAVWDAFTWDGENSQFMNNTLNEPFCARIFLMDDSMQSDYENAGLIFP